GWRTGLALLSRSTCGTKCCAGLSLGRRGRYDGEKFPVALSEVAAQCPLSPALQRCPLFDERRRSADGVGGLYRESSEASQTSRGARRLLRFSSRRGRQDFYNQPRGQGYRLETRTRLGSIGHE